MFSVTGKILRIAFFAMLMSSFSASADSNSVNRPFSDADIVKHSTNPPDNRNNITFFLENGEDPKKIKINIIKDYCGDIDGCTVRISEFDGQENGTMETAIFPLFYNEKSHYWRSQTAGPVRNRDSIQSKLSDYSACWLVDEMSSGTGDKDFYLIHVDLARSSDCLVVFVD
jgi:hypothetical protein